MERMKPEDTLSFSVKKSRTRADLGRWAATEAGGLLEGLLENQRELSVIFAAAPSQNEFLENLCQNKNVDFTRIRAFHMDEYLGLPKDAPQGFGNFLRNRIFDRLPFKSVEYIDGNADPETECERYSELLRCYPAEVVFMGIGENGHIAFNDPHEADFSDKKLVKVVELDQICRAQQVHDGCFASLDQVPKRALTLTVPALAAARFHICVVPGASKAQAVRDAVYGPLTEKCPASILRTCKNAMLYVDQESGSAL